MTESPRPPSQPAIEAVGRVGVCRARQLNPSQRDPRLQMMGISCIRRAHLIKSTPRSPDNTGHSAARLCRQLLGKRHSGSSGESA